MDCAAHILFCRVEGFFKPKTSVDDGGAGWMNERMKEASVSLPEV